MSEQWFYVAEGVQKGPVDRDRLAQLAHENVVLKPTLIWKAGMAEWTPAGQLHPDIFPVEEWFYATAGGQGGPVDMDGLLALVARAQIQADTPIWKKELGAWTPAGQILKGVFQPPRVPEAAIPAGRQRGFMGNIGARISDVADLPTISSVPIRDILVGGLGQAASFKAVETEDAFAVGTKQTTPRLAEVDAGWPRLKMFWRMLGGSLATYLLLWYGLTHFGNPNFFPGLMVIGSFVVPFSVVVAFFELNAPRNVSIYEVVKMLILGGALSLVVTMFVFAFIPGSGTGDLIPALLTGVCEETGKALVLLLVISSARYPYQINGLLFGAAVGAGFAGFESAGYAFNNGLRVAVGYGIETAAKAGASTVQDVMEKVLNDGMFAFIKVASDIIWLRGILAPGGHVIWTAMIGSALWKAKGTGPFSFGTLFAPVVLRRWGIAVVLHGIWDADIPLVPTLVKLALLIIVGWYLILAITKQALGEVEEARVQARTVAGLPAIKMP